MDTKTNPAVKTTTRTRTKHRANPIAKSTTETTNASATATSSTTNGKNSQHHAANARDRQPQPRTSKLNGQNHTINAQDQPPTTINPNTQPHPSKPDTKAPPTNTKTPNQHPPVKPNNEVEELQPNATESDSNSRLKAKAKKAPRAARAESQNVHFKLVMEAAKAIVGILKEHDIPCAVFGSLAAKLYGSSRCPKDVDIIISQPVAPESDSTSETSDSSTRPHIPDGTPTAATRSSSSSTPPTKEPLNPAQIKNLILSKNSRHFYLKMPRDPTAEYRILWYRESYMGPECKVDILIPGIMHLPFLTPHQTRLIDDIPVVPFSLLLLHKLQGWDDHRKAAEGYQQKKQQQDAGDVRKLMGLKREMGVVKCEMPWGDLGLFSEEFQKLTKERVWDYCLEFPERIEGWRFLGFDVPDVVDTKAANKAKEEVAATDVVKVEVEVEIEEQTAKSA